MRSIDLSVIIVNYKDPHLLCQSIRSMARYSTPINYEIIVVDNNSCDESEELLKDAAPNAKWIQMGYNSGFAKANNVGLKSAQGKYVLYLNADTIFVEEIFSKLISEMEKNPKIGAIGCHTLNPDGTPQLSYHNGDLFFRKLRQRNPLAIKLFNSSERAQKDTQNIEKLHQHNHNPRWITGAVLLMNREIIAKNHFEWDEDFFMYWEDVELCHRIRKAGFKIQYLAQPQIIHIGGGGENVPLARFVDIENNKLLCIKKMYGNFISKFYKLSMQIEIQIEAFLQQRKNIEYGSMLSKELNYYCNQ